MARRSVPDTAPSGRPPACPGPWTPLDVARAREAAAAFVVGVDRWIAWPMTTLAALATAAAAAGGALGLAAGAAAAGAALRWAIGLDVRLPRALAAAARGETERARAALVEIADGPTRPSAERIVALAELATCDMVRAEWPGALHWTERLARQVPPTAEDDHLRIGLLRVLCRARMGHGESLAAALADLRIPQRLPVDTWVAGGVVGFVLTENTPVLATDLGARLGAPPGPLPPGAPGATARSFAAWLAADRIAALRAAQAALGDPGALPPWLVCAVERFARRLRSIRSYR